MIFNKSFISFILVSTCLSTLNATTFNWNVGNGDWALGTNWNPVGPPTINDTANIANGGTPRTDTDSPTAGIVVTDNGSGINFTSQNLTSQTAIIGSTTGTSQVTVNALTWNNNTGAGSFLLGDFADGRITIQNGGILNTTTTQAAANAGSSADITVQDPNSAWNNTGDFKVGLSGNIANFTVRQGAALNTGSIEFGVNAGNNFNAIIRDANTTFTNAGNLVVGVSRTCTLSVNNSAKASTGSCVVGQNTGITGTLTVNNAPPSGVTWTCTGNFTIAQSGTGIFNLTSNATASTGTTTIGSLAGSSGSATCDATSTWTNTGTLTIGSAGIGLMNVTNNSQVTAGSILMAVSNSGTLNVATNSRLTTGSITGGAGVGSFTLNNATLQASGVVPALFQASQQQLSQTQAHSIARLLPSLSRKI
ncbi:MAG: hypothetical protein HWD61_14840 [Parachlamydiaceae bacterium]|nr:MAG: hypothetical protein HWD61_14840 [Parachlamydiaceae bacterium]